MSGGWGFARYLVGHAVMWLAVGSIIASDSGIERLDGRWVFVGGDAERQRRLDAIERTVEQMSWVAGGIARKRIRASTEISDWYEFRVDGPLVTIIDEGGDDFLTRWDGTPLYVTKEQGGPATLVRTWGNGALRSQWKEPKGAGTEIYRVSEDGGSMTVTMTVSSKRLPSDVVYDLTYRRSEGPGSV